VAQKPDQAPIWTTTGVPPCPNEAEEKDLLEPDRIKDVANLQKYKDETRARRDVKVKLRELEVGDLVLLRTPHTESSGKQKSKWAGTYLVVEKPRAGAYHLSNSQGEMLEHS
jgi:hypothetical protein